MWKREVGIHFILAFPRNVQGALTQEQKKVIRTLVAQLRKEKAWWKTGSMEGGRTSGSCSSRVWKRQSRWRKAVFSRPVFAVARSRLGRCG
jgi:hypothetical protein